jgi:hypothetical protein
VSKILQGAGAYVVLTFALAFVWNMILFRDNYVSMGSQSVRGEPIMPLGLAAIVIAALVLAFLFSKFFAGSMRPAVILALAVGAFSITYGAFVVPAKFAIEPIAMYVLLEATFGLLHYAAAGVALAFVFKKT